MLCYIHRMESYSVITGNELMKWTNAQHGLMDESKMKNEVEQNT